MPASESFIGFIVAGFVASLGWAGTLTKQSYDNKEKIALLDERTRRMDGQLEKMDGKLDRLVEHLLDKEE